MRIKERDDGSSRNNQNKLNIILKGMRNVINQ